MHFIPEGSFLAESTSAFLAESFEDEVPLLVVVGLEVGHFDFKDVVGDDGEQFAADLAVVVALFEFIP